jgi:phage minor structural protein
MKIDRAEIWSDLKANSGTHQTTVAKHELLRATLDENLDGKLELQLTLDRNSAAWSSVTNQRVVRLIYDTGDVAEFRIMKPTEGRSTLGAIGATIKAQGILMDLNNGMVHRTEANGTQTLFYTLLNLTRSDLVTLIVAKAPAYFAVGTITDGATVVPAFTFEFDTPLRALQELAAMEGLELAVRRNGDTDYKVDLLSQVGSGADQPEFRYRKNLQGVAREIDGAGVANRIYPAGGGDDAIRLSIGNARWRVNNVPSTTEIDLDDNPIYEDDALNGKYIERADGTKFQITDSAYTNQRITTGSAHGLNVGDLVYIRVNAGGDQLVFVESPTSQAQYGVLVDVTQESDIPPVVNLAPNSTFSEWTGSVPDEWSAIGTPTLSEETSALYTQVGGSAAKVIADAEGEGIQSDAFSINPTNPNVYFSAFVMIYVASGEVEFYLDHSTDGRFPLEGADELAFTNEQGKFIQLAIAGKEFPTGTVRLKVVARNGAATFYVDAAQCTQTADNYPFYSGDAARALWARGLLSLSDRAVPKVSYDVDVLDLTSADSAAWPYDAVTLGGTVLVEDEQLSLQVTTRAVSVYRDLVGARTIRLELSNRHEDIIDVLTRRTRRTRMGMLPRPSLALINQFEVATDGEGNVHLRVWGGGATRSFRYIADTQTMPTIAEVIASGGDGIVSNYVDGSEVTVSAFRNGASVLGRNDRCYVRVVAYPILNAGGVPGTSVVATTGYSAYWSAEILDTEVAQSGNEATGNAIVTRSYEPDYRTASIRVYRRKDNWPTKDGTQTGQLDPKYDRGTIGPNDLWQYKDGGYSGSDVVYDIAVAMDVNGVEGERQEDNYTVTTSPTPHFTDAYRGVDDTGTNCTSDRRSDTVYWATANVTDANHCVRVYRKASWIGTWEEIKEEQSPLTNQDYTDDECPMWGYKIGGTENGYVTYRLVLQNTAKTVTYDLRTLEDILLPGWWSGLCYEA